MAPRSSRENPNSIMRELIPRDDKNWRKWWRKLWCGGMAGLAQIESMAIQTTCGGRSRLAAWSMAANPRQWG